MMTPAHQDVPARITVRMALDEGAVATLRGRAESGFVLSERRLFAWRGNGAIGPVPLTAIDRILVDTGPGSDHHDIVVLPRLAMHPPLVLTRRANELVGTLGFVAELAAALGVEPVTERLGAVHRFSFPKIVVA